MQTSQRTLQRWLAGGIGALFFGAAGLTANATPVTTDLAFWLKADEGLTVDGGNVTRWDSPGELYGFGWASGRSSTEAPTLTAGGLNDLPVVSFDGSAADGSGQALELSGLPNINNHDIGNSMSYFIVYTANSDGVLFAYGDSNRGPRLYAFDGDQLRWGSRWENNLGTSPASASETGGYLGEFHYTGDSGGSSQTLNDMDWSIGIDGLFNSGEMENLTQYEHNNPALGNRFGSQQLTGSIAEILIYERELSAAEREQVGFYLEQKWGLDTVYIPEPGSLALLGLGGLLMLRRRAHA